MWKQLINAFALLAVLTLLTGFVYPLLITALAQTLMPFPANGSIAVKDGKPAGSLLIGQQFSSPAYFHGRPSAAGAGYDGTLSGGSNLGPTNKKLIANTAGNLRQVRAENGLSATEEVPADFVLASASGLDPDISPAAAYLQAGRVAAVRRLDAAQIHNLIDSMIKNRQWGILGEARVNVLELNLKLDALTP